MPRLTSFDHVCFPKVEMSCHARRCRPCVLSKGGDVKPRPKSFDIVCHLRAMIECHARRCSTVCAVKGDDGMPHPTSFDRVCCLKVVMACTPNVVRPCLPFKGYDGMPRPTLFNRVMSKGSDVMPRSMLTTMCVVQGRCCHAMLDVADRVCCPKAIMACHARRRSTVCTAQRR